MKNLNPPFLFLLFLLSSFVIHGCKDDSFHITQDNTLAWCIVPFDAKERTPQQRIALLKELGFTRYAYDWRTKHLDEMAEEIRLARENDIEISAAWLWINADRDTLGKLSPDNQRLFEILKETGLQTTIWMSFSGNYFEGLSHNEALEKGIQMVDYIVQLSQESGGRVALYNHGDWFGDPRNQVEIIQALPGSDLGIIYNFHHAHNQLEEYPDMVNSMLPYLWTVNLNGMKKEGPKIMTLGQGDLEKDMIQLLWDKGYKGPWGILGHIETEDVKVVLERNLAGLEKLNNH